MLLTPSGGVKGRGESAQLTQPYDGHLVWRWLPTGGNGLCALLIVGGVSYPNRDHLQPSASRRWASSSHGCSSAHTGSIYPTVLGTPCGPHERRVGPLAGGTGIAGLATGAWKRPRKRPVGYPSSIGVFQVSAQAPDVCLPGARRWTGLLPGLGPFLRRAGVGFHCLRRGITIACSAGRDPVDTPVVSHQRGHSGKRSQRLGVHHRIRGFHFHACRSEPLQRQLAKHLLRLRGSRPWPCRFFGWRWVESDTPRYEAEMQSQESSPFRVYPAL